MPRRVASYAVEDVELDNRDRANVEYRRRMYALFLPLELDELDRLKELGKAATKEQKAERKRLREYTRAMPDYEAEAVAEKAASERASRGRPPIPPPSAKQARQTDEALIELLAELEEKENDDDED